MHAILILPGTQENSCSAMSFHNIPAMGEGHPLKAETFPASSVKDTSCFTQNIIVKYFLYWAKCVWYWGVGEGKDLASVGTLGPGIYVTDCQEVLAEFKCLQQQPTLNCTLHSPAVGIKRPAWNSALAHRHGPKSERWWPQTESSTEGKFYQGESYQLTMLPNGYDTCTRASV